MDLSPSQQSFRKALTAGSAASRDVLITSADDLATPAASLANPPPLLDLPQPSLLGAGLPLLIDLKKAKATHTREERARFILNDLGVPLHSLAAAFVAPISAHFLIEFLPEQEAAYLSALRRLHAGVPWPVAGCRLVHG